MEFTNQYSFINLNGVALHTGTHTKINQTWIYLLWCWTTSLESFRSIWTQGTNTHRRLKFYRNMKQNHWSKIARVCGEILVLVNICFIWICLSIITISLGSILLTSSDIKQRYNFGCSYLQLDPRRSVGVDLFWIELFCIPWSNWHCSCQSPNWNPTHAVRENKPISSAVTEMSQSRIRISLHIYHFC